MVHLSNAILIFLLTPAQSLAACPAELRAANEEVDKFRETYSVFVVLASGYTSRTSSVTHESLLHVTTLVDNMLRSIDHTEIYDSDLDRVAHIQAHMIPAVDALISFPIEVLEKELSENIREEYLIRFPVSVWEEHLDVVDEAYAWCTVRTNRLLSERTEGIIGTHIPIERLVMVGATLLVIVAFFVHLLSR